MKQNTKLYKLTVSALLMAVGMVLPFLVGQIPALAKVFSPLHIPAFICGLTCGPVYGAVLGFILPLLRGALFGIPVFPVTAVAMAFELSVYGLLTGFLYPVLAKQFKLTAHIPAIVVSMLVAMFAGRIAGGAARAVIMGVQGNGYSFAAFLSAYFIGTAVGAVLHLVIVPLVVTALEKARLSPMVDLDT